MTQTTVVIYSARPIFTYRPKKPSVKVSEENVAVGHAYVSFLKEWCPKAAINDPGDPEGLVSARAEELVAEHSIDPATGRKSEQYYNEHGSKHVMAFFTNDVVGACTMGVGLLCPVLRNGVPVLAPPAGVSAEMEKMFALGRPVWLCYCLRVPAPMAETAGGIAFRFSALRIVRIERLDEIDPVTQKPLLVFHTEADGSFRQLSVDETRARMYTPMPGGGWDRENLQPYFLD